MLPESVGFRALRGQGAESLGNDYLHFYASSPHLAAYPAHHPNKRVSDQRALEIVEPHI